VAAGNAEPAVSVFWGWVVAAVQLAAVIWLAALTAGWWKLRRILRDIERARRLAGRVGE
jgi:hypothetical protein